MEVLFRLKGLYAAQHRDILVATDKYGSLYPAVQYKGGAHDKHPNGHHNVDLKIKTERDVQDDGYTQETVVTRDVPDKLWDLLGIFPRTASTPENQRDEVIAMVTEVKRRAHSIRDYMDTVIDQNRGEEGDIIAASHARTHSLFIIDVCHNLEKSLTPK